MTLWSLVCGATGPDAIFRRAERFSIPKAYGGWDRMTEREVDIVTGCLLLISAAPTGMHLAASIRPSSCMAKKPTCACAPAAGSGAKPRVTPEAVIVHYDGASQTVRADKMVRLLKAKRLLIARHFPAWQRPLARTLFAATPLSRWLAPSGLGLRAARSKQARVWTEIWTRRAEWRGAGG